MERVTSTMIANQIEYINSRHKLDLCTDYAYSKCAIRANGGGTNITGYLTKREVSDYLSAIEKVLERAKARAA